MSASTDEHADTLIDHRVIFIAACSSFITLVLLNILPRFQHLQFNKKIADNIHIVTNTYKLQKLKKTSLSTSNQLLFADMITKDFYIHNLYKGEGEYFESQEYWNLIPYNNPKWLHTKLKLLIKGRYSEALHQTMLDHFDPKAFEPSSNPYLKEITTAIYRFNEWRRFNGWRYRTTKNNMKVWTRSLPNSQLEIVKAEKVLSLPLLAIVGVLMNEEHIYAMDPILKHMDMVKITSLSSALIRLCVKCPFPIKDRDFVNVAMIYLFKDGSCLMGSTKCNDESLFKDDKEYVRATITLMMYHIRPNYDGDINQTKVTFYSHVLMNGSIPQWMLNFAYMEIADTLLKMEKYVKNKLNTLYKKGQLYIPPNPFLKMIGL